MYQTYYGLSCKPFQLNPDPSFYYASKQHRRAKAYLEYGVQRNEGFIVITGEVGAGKTTMVRGLLASLGESQVVAANLVTTYLEAEDTLRMVGAAFGVPIKGASKSEVLMALEAFFVTRISQGKRCLLIVDEAQNLTPMAVEELRMLSNFQFGQQSMLQTFLVGQPEFRNILQSPEMLQLRQRVTATCHVGPLDLDETRGYIQHRLKCAGAIDRPSFDDAASEVIFKASGGIPRRINLLCDRLLLLGFLNQIDAFGLEQATEVVDELNAESAVPLPTPPSRQSVWGDDPATDDTGTSMPGLDLDLSHPLVTPGLHQSLLSQLDRQGVEQYDSRLRRLEDGLLRQERTQLEMLMVLKQILAAASHPKPDTAP